MTAFMTYAKEARAKGETRLAKRIETEGRIARALVKAGLAKGYAVSVSDGEEWTVKGATKLAKIMEALFSTDGDTIRFRQAADPFGPLVADFDLVYGNDGYDVIADYTDNEAAQELMAAIADTLERAENYMA